MSLLVLILSWASLGLEAAAAVVSAGARPCGSGTQRAGGPNSRILGLGGALRGRTWVTGSEVGAGLLDVKAWKLKSWTLGL